MSLQTTVADIITRLRQGKFPNEQAISQGIILRVFSELNWDTWDTNIVWPEYQTGEGRADFALCHPSAKPVILIEVKQPGKAEDAVEQALKYAFHTGTPFIVLTDGQTWSFYLPAEQGSYEDRRVYKLDLYERSPEEAAEILQRYLLRSRVESGEALQDAQKEYRSRNRRSQAKATIPEAWRDLVEKGNEQLVEMLAGAIEAKAGVRPDADDVTEFLRRLEEPSANPQISSNRSKSILLPPSTTAPNSSQQRTKTNLPIHNGEHQPKEGTLTRTIWDIADKLTAKNGTPARRWQVVEALPKMKFRTVATQYFRWRKYHGIKGRLC